MNVILIAPVMYWLFAHIIFCAYILNDKVLKIIILLLVLSFLLLSYFYKNTITYDLNWYIEYFDNPWPMEPFFYQTTIFLKYFLEMNAFQILYFWQLFIFILLFISLTNIVSGFNILKFVFILGSAFFMLVSQNGLRQGISLCLILLGLSFLIKKQLKSALFFMGLATLTHTSGFLFSAISFIFHCSYNIINSKYIRSKYAYAVCGLFVGIVLLLAIKKYSDADSIYLDPTVDWGSERSPSYLKLIAIFIAYSVSSLLISLSSHIKSCTLIYFKNFRTFYLFILIPLSFLPEAFARFTFFYYAIELMFLIILLIESIKIRNKIASIFIFLAYGFAPNAINTLSN